MLPQVPQAENQRGLRTFGSVPALAANPSPKGQVDSCQKAIYSPLPPGERGEGGTDRSGGSEIHCNVCFADPEWQRPDGRIASRLGKELRRRPLMDTLGIGMIGSGFMGLTYSEVLARHVRGARLVAVAGG